MRRIFFLVIAAGVLLSGCAVQRAATSRVYWAGAELALSEASNPDRDGSTSFQSRQPLYQKSCNRYLEAYDRDHRAFGLQSIGKAVHACQLAGDYDTALLFSKFQDRYADAHPIKAVHWKPSWFDLGRERSRTAI